MTAARPLGTRVAVTLAAALVAAGAGLAVSRANADGALPGGGTAAGRFTPGGFGGRPGVPPASFGGPSQQTGAGATDPAGALPRQARGTPDQTGAPPQQASAPR